MFGDDIILGRTVSKLDDKGRVCLPSFTGRQYKDKLVLVEFDEDKACIYKYDSYVSQIEELKEKIKLSKTVSERRKYELEMYSICKKILKVLNVDVNGRVIIGDLFKDHEYLNIIGSIDSVIIEPSKKI
ncbi:MAG: hypothetical protein Q4E75_03075 [bacterium]|nr:hypothetical protein [bacterium]